MKNKTIVAELDVDGVVIHMTTRVRSIMEGVARINVEVTSPMAPDFYESVDMTYSMGKTWGIPYATVNIPVLGEKRTFIGPWVSVRAQIWIGKVTNNLGSIA